MPVGRECLDCGEITTRPRTPGRGTRCETCEPVSVRADQQRQAAHRAATGQGTIARGYGAEHRALRARLAVVVAAGEANCWRCGRQVPPGTPWHLGHVGSVGSPHAGIEHVRCNIDASNAPRES